MILSRVGRPTTATYEFADRLDFENTSLFGNGIEGSVQGFEE
jgi:hypothetical protein